MTAGAPDAGVLVEGTSAPAEQGSRREAAREAIVAKIPASYSPAAHFLIPAALGASILGASVWLIEGLRPVELLTIPVTLFLGLGLEWRVHKSVLHERQPLLGILYVRHELYHHVVYTYDDMTMRSSREWRLVLMPAYALFLVFAGMIPVVAAVWYAGSRNVALLHLATSMLFFLAYEWMHLAYHLPQSHPIGRLGFVRRLRGAAPAAPRSAADEAVELQRDGAALRLDPQERVVAGAGARVAGEPGAAGEAGPGVRRRGGGEKGRGGVRPPERRERGGLVQGRAVRGGRTSRAASSGASRGPSPRRRRP